MSVLGFFLFRTLKLLYNCGAPAQVTLLRDFKHPNVVRLLGVHTSGLTERPLGGVLQKLSCRYPVLLPFSGKLEIFKIAKFFKSFKIFPAKSFEKIGN